MEKVEFYVTKGFGEHLRDSLNYSQAVRFGDRVEISGQGGWTDEMHFPEDMRDQYTLAFANVGRVLAEAGASWDEVIGINSYHVGLDDEAMYLMAELFRKHMPNHKPIWTMLGVAKLGDARMRVEIRATAIIRHPT
jgi:enamine deaminase RidA (YjgF/YER057c/UK114 family)